MLRFVLIMLAALALAPVSHAQEVVETPRPIERPTTFAAIPIILTISGPMTMPPERAAEASEIVEVDQPNNETVEETPETPITEPESVEDTQETEDNSAEPETLVGEENPEGTDPGALETTAALPEGFILPPTRPATDETAEDLTPRPIERIASIPRKQPILRNDTVVDNTTVSDGGTIIRGSDSTPPLPSGCFNQLRALNVSYARLPDRGSTNGCHLRNAVAVTRFDGVQLRPPGELTCATAVATARWLRDEVRPEARQQLGRTLNGITHYSTFSCRRRPSGRISEHGYGNAIDVARFHFTDGSTVTIDPDWNAGGSVTRFLRNIVRASCEYFSVILSPDSDADHFNHFHLDNGRWRVCIN